jgi:hypothetical protein
MVIRGKGTAMSTKLMSIAAVAVALVTVASAAASGPAAARQRVAITAKGGIHGFVLTPREAGVVKRDSGTATSCCWSERVVRRDGQRIEINDPLTTFVGKHGTVQIRFRIEWVDAGNGYGVGTGTWKVVRGSGAYTGLTGSGRSAHAWLPHGLVSWRAEGFLSLRSNTEAATRTADAEKASLKHYLSAMSWPVRASLLRAQFVTASIDGFLDPGDPPFLRQVAIGCRELRALEARGRLLRISAPARLKARQRNLLHTYSAMRRGCKRASESALTLLAAMQRFYETGSDADKAAMERADRAAHTTLRRFEGRELRSFFEAVRTWRSAALRYAGALGVPKPKWLTALPVSP